MADLLIVGDSIAAGEYVEPGASWPDLALRELQASIVLHNYSVDGQTILGAIAGVLPILDRGHYATSIIALGVNDSRLSRYRGHSSKQFVDDFRRLASPISELSDRLFVVGQFPIVDGFLPEGELEKGWGRSSQHRIELGLKLVSEELKATFIPLLDRLVESSFRLGCLSTDGLHPNAAGHTAIWRMVKPYILPSQV